jgi:hypothetical protein
MLHPPPPLLPHLLGVMTMTTSASSACQRQERSASWWVEVALYACCSQPGMDSPLLGTPCELTQCCAMPWVRSMAHQCTSVCAAPVRPPSVWEYPAPCAAHEWSECLTSLSDTPPTRQTQHQYLPRQGNNTLYQQTPIQKHNDDSWAIDSHPGCCTPVVYSRRQLAQLTTGATDLLVTGSLKSLLAVVTLQKEPI